MKLLSLIMIMTILSSCGNSSDGTAPAGTQLFTSQQADLFIQQLKTKAPYKSGQSKMIFEDLSKKISSSLTCNYWEDRTIEVRDVQPTTIEIYVDSKSTLMDNENSSCPTTNSDDFTKTKLMTKTDFENNTTRFIKFYIDHNFRCSENKKICVSSRFVSSRDEDLKGVPTVVVVTEYTYNDGTTGELTTWVSKRNLFEGILKYRLVDKQTKKWWSIRGFFSANY